MDIAGAQDHTFLHHGCSECEAALRIRSSDRSHNIILLKPQIDTGHHAFKSNNSLFHTANRLYFGLYRPLNPSLNYLFRFARICYLAEELHVALAAQLLETDYSKSSRSHLPGKRLDTASYGRFIENVLPYMLALADFFECYHDELAHYAPFPTMRAPF